jgi:hypothetical protein
MELARTLAAPIDADELTLPDRGQRSGFGVEGVTQLLGQADSDASKAGDSTASAIRFRLIIDGQLRTRSG